MDLLVLIDRDAEHLGQNIGDRAVLAGRHVFDVSLGDPVGVGAARQDAGSAGADRDRGRRLDLDLGCATGAVPPGVGTPCPLSDGVGASWAAAGVGRLTMIRTPSSKAEPDRMSMPTARRALAVAAIGPILTLLGCSAGSEYASHSDHHSHVSQISVNRHAPAHGSLPFL